MGECSKCSSRNLKREASLVMGCQNCGALMTCEQSGMLTHMLDNTPSIETKSEQIRRTLIDCLGKLGLKVNPEYNAELTPLKLADAIKGAVMIQLGMVRF